MLTSSLMDDFTPSNRSISVMDKSFYNKKLYLRPNRLGLVDHLSCDQEQELIKDIQNFLEVSVIEMIEEIRNKPSEQKITQEYVFDWIRRNLGFLCLFNSQLVDAYGEKSLIATVRDGDDITHIRIRKFFKRVLSSVGIVVEWTGVYASCGSYSKPIILDSHHLEVIKKYGEQTFFDKYQNKINIEMTGMSMNTGMGLGMGMGMSTGMSTGMSMDTGIRMSETRFTQKLVSFVDKEHIAWSKFNNTLENSLCNLRNTDYSNSLLNRDICWIYERIFGPETNHWMHNIRDENVDHTPTKRERSVYELNYIGFLHSKRMTLMNKVNFQDDKAVLDSENTKKISVKQLLVLHSILQELYEEMQEFKSSSQFILYSEITEYMFNLYTRFFEEHSSEIISCAQQVTTLVNNSFVSSSIDTDTLFILMKSNLFVKQTFTDAFNYHIKQELISTSKPHERNSFEQYLDTTNVFPQDISSLLVLHTGLSQINKLDMMSFEAKLVLSYIDDYRVHITNTFNSLYIGEDNEDENEDEEDDDCSLSCFSDNETNTSHLL